MHYMSAFQRNVSHDISKAMAFKVKIRLTDYTGFNKAIVNVIDKTGQSPSLTPHLLTVSCISPALRDT